MYLFMKFQITNDFHQNCLNNCWILEKN